MKTIKAQFSVFEAAPNPKPTDSKETDMISWGDCMWWDLASVRNGIIDLYGEDSVTAIQKDEDGKQFFGYDDNVDIDKVGDHIGVKHSSSSASSSYSIEDQKKLCNAFEKLKNGVKISSTPYNPKLKGGWKKPRKNQWCGGKRRSTRRYG